MVCISTVIIWESTFCRMCCLLVAMSYFLQTVDEGDPVECSVSIWACCTAEAKQVWKTWSAPWMGSDPGNPLSKLDIGTINDVLKISWWGWIPVSRLYHLRHLLWGWRLNYINEWMFLHTQKVPHIQIVETYLLTYILRFAAHKTTPKWLLGRARVELFSLTNSFLCTTWQCVKMPSFT